MTPRRRSRDLEPLHGEVVNLPAVEARPVVRRERAVVESVAGLPAERHVTNNYYVQAPAGDAGPDAPVERVPSWGTAATFMAVICVLVAIGVGLWFAQAAPWQTDAQQHRAVPAHHTGAGR